MAPQAITMTRASSVTLSPVAPNRHVTLRAVEFATVLMRTTKAVGDQFDRLAAARPEVGGQRHRNITVIGRTLGLQIARRAQGLEAPLEAVAAEGAALRLREVEFARIFRLPGRSARLEDGVLLRAKGCPGDVLGGLHRQSQTLRATVEDLPCAHRRGLHRQCRLHPLAIRYKFAVAKREQVGRIVGVAVLPHSPGRPGMARGEFA